MDFDVITIIVCGVLLLLAVVAPFCNVLFLKPYIYDSTEEEDGDTEKSKSQPLPDFSIILSVHDKAEELERNLPAVLEQNYAGRYEVIVVDESSTDCTNDVLTRLKARYDNLYSTFIPESSHYLSRRKLALTIGVKAAHYDWIIFTDSDCRPDSQDWLTAMSRYCTDAEGKDIVMGYTRYDSSATCYERFDRISTWFRQARKAQKSTAFAYCGHNLAMRKSIFMSHNGFLANLKYLRGEYDFIVNEYSQQGNAAAVSEPSVRMTQDAPTKKGWNNDHLFFIDTMKHLDRVVGYKLPHSFFTTLLHLNIILQVAAIAISTAMEYYIITICGVVALLLTLLLRIIIARRAMKAIEEDIPAWKIPLMEIMEIWVNLSLCIRHKRSDKYDFIRR